VSNILITEPNRCHLTVIYIISELYINYFTDSASQSILCVQKFIILLFF